MAEFTRRRSGHGRDYDNLSKSGTIEWDAYDAAWVDADDVRADGSFPVEINSTWPDGDTELKCKRYSIRRVSNAQRLFRVVATYEKPTGGASEHEDDTENPLSSPPEIRWSDIVSNEPVDRDYNDNPIVNSAGVGFEGGVNRRFITKQLTFTRNESSFSVTDGLAYENTVNSDSFLGAQPKEVFCAGIAPTTVYTASSTYVSVAYTFEFRAIGIWGADPHQPRVRDEGYMAWAVIDDVESLVEIRTKTGTIVTSPVLLDGKGRPIDPDGSGLTYRTGEGGPLETEPSWSQRPVPEYVAQEGAGDAVYLRFKAYEPKAFAPLNIAI